MFKSFSQTLMTHFAFKNEDETFCKVYFKKYVSRRSVVQCPCFF